MRGNSFGNLFTITTFGESHGVGLGVTIDGMPSGFTISLDDLQDELNKRRPGRLKISTARNEMDQAEILSGVFENKTLGTPISIIFRNTNQRSQDYNELKNEYRPGHADRTTTLKFGHRDHRGGGRASGRETVARVAAGYFAGLLLKDTQFFSYIKQSGPFDFNAITTIPSTKRTDSGLIDESKEEDFKKYVLTLKEQGDSIGGQVRLIIQNCPAALGEPVFDKLKADLSKAMTSIGSCMGVLFGRGVEFATLKGSEISSDSTNFSGIEGGISNGENIYCDIFFKAPSTIGDKAKEGRHDPCILPRVLPVVESMAKIVLADHLLRQKAFTISEP